MYEELIKRLRDIASHDSNIESNYIGLALLQAANAIEDLENKLNLWRQDKISRWIPVTERLPEKHEWVLVRSKLVKMKTDFISNDGTWYTTPGVTHWMPLPEPPKEEC